MKLAFALLAALVLGLAGATWWALESGGVAVLETRRADGAPRRTHVWVAEEEGELWLEAATPERAWLQDVQRSPEVVLTRGARAERFRAVPAPGERERARVRALLRRQYGLRDAWVGLVQDTSRAVAVRLAPLPARE